MNQNYPNLELNHQLCFALYAATNAVTRAYREGLEKAGLTYTQYLVMLALWEENNLNVGTIAKRLHLDPPTLTPLLKRIEIAGFIKRKRNMLDERIVEVELTEKGREIQQKIANVQHSVECKTGLCQEDFIKLKDSLHLLINTMHEQEMIQQAA